MRCVACGSEVDIVEHHLSYEPEIKIPLCRKCHYCAHHDERKYPPPLRYPPSYQNALLLRGYLVALILNDGKLRCWICAIKGGKSLFENEQDFLTHFYDSHFKSEWWKIEGMKKVD